MKLADGVKRTERGYRCMYCYSGILNSHSAQIHDCKKALETVKKRVPKSLGSIIGGYHKQVSASRGGGKLKGKH